MNVPTGLAVTADGAVVVLYNDNSSIRADNNIIFASTVNNTAYGARI